MEEVGREPIALESAHIPCAVLFLDPERRVRFCTASAARLLGRPPAELPGLRIDAFEHEASFIAAIRTACRAKREAAPVVFSLKRHTLEPERWMIWPEHDAAGALAGFWLTTEADATCAEAATLRRYLTEEQRLGDALTRIDSLIHSVLDFDEIMARVVVEAARAIGAESAAVYVQSGSEWEARYTYGRIDPIRGRRYTDDQLKPSMRALRQQRPVLINDVTRGSEVRDELVEKFGVRALLDAPLIVADAPVGNLSLYHHSDAKFTDAHERFLTRVGAAVSIALQNAARFESLGRAEAALRESEARLRRQAEELETIYTSAPIGLAVLDAQGRFIRINRRLAEFNGVPAEKHIGKTAREVVPTAAEVIESLAQRVLSAGEAVRNFEFAAETPARPGETRFWNEHWLPLKDETGRVWGVNVVVEETTDRHRLEERTRHLAEHDPLTHLPNRLLLLELLDQALRAAKRHHRKLGVMFMDLDRFKAINDTLGHTAGDELLRQVALRLQGKLRRSDTVARYGGDEFTVLLPEIVQGDEVVEVAEQLLRSFERPFEVSGKPLSVTTSIGISVFPDDSTTPEGLLRHADLAMYDAKESGRNTYRFYNAVVDRRARGRLRLEKALRKALHRGGLHLDYQPEVDLRSGAITGVEALIRWHHPQMGLIGPGRFIPVAEETDLIMAVDDWALHTACRQAQQWREQGVPPITLSINLSAKSFTRIDLVERVSRHMEEFGIARGQLELELTERTVMHHVERTIDRMHELVGIGVRLAVDDFGTGYSSLSYLKRLPFDKVKIDKSFVDDIDEDADDQAIIRGVTGLAHTLGKRVTAEGVERESQRAFLNEAACDEAQGFLFSRPLTAAQVAKRFLQ